MGKTRLVGDIGGTNARFAIARDGIYDLFLTFTAADYPSLAAAITEYFGRIGLAAPDRPLEAALSIAGPVEGDRIDFTNHKEWSFSLRALGQELGFDRVDAFNDFSAAALALPYLEPGDLVAVGGGTARPRSPKGVVGPGTGLGMGGLIPGPGDSWIPLSGEGGHADMPPVDAEQDRIIEELRRRFDHVSAERVLSGRGLVNLHNALAQIHGSAEVKVEPAEVTNSAEPLCREAVDQFCAMLGTVAGNLALTLGAIGGVYIGGGIVPRLGERFIQSGFRKRFVDKGRFEAYLDAIPTWVITHPNPAMVGLSHLP